MCNTVAIHWKLTTTNGSHHWNWSCYNCTRIWQCNRSMVIWHLKKIGKVNQLDKWLFHVLVTQSYLTLCDPMDCSLPGSSVHGILQARIVEWVAMPFSRVSSWPRDWTCIAYRFNLADRFFTTSIMWEALMSWQQTKKSHFEVLSPFILSNNEPFLDQIVTCDEKWILFDNQWRPAQWLDWEEALKHFSKLNFHQKMVMMIVWWSAACLIH